MGKIPEGYNVDEPQCVLVEAGKVKVPEISVAPLEVDMGDMVMEPASGIKGTIMGRVDFLNGCTRFGVQPGLDKDGKFVEVLWFAAGRLKPLVLAVKKPSRELPGGPMERLPSRY
jgi:hypothetical protein